MRGAVLLDKHRPPRDVTPEELADVAKLSRWERHNWQDAWAEVSRRRDPVASYQRFREALADCSTIDYTQITGTAEAAAWNMTGASPVPPTLIAANGVRAGQILHVVATGVMTTPASAATTLTITPRWGAAVSGTALGASGVSNTAIISRTNDPWQLEYMLSVRQVGAAGSVVGGGRFTCPAIGTAAANPGSLVFGSTAGVAVDTTVAAGIWMGFTLAGSASWTSKALQVTFESLN